MKRSEIDRYIAQATDFFRQHGFHLPLWADWSPEQWAAAGRGCGEIRENALGWDLTDFGSGDFLRQGLTLFTLRNGNPRGGGKTYCEKIMLVRENQVTPTHFHWQKTEDIINRGGGTLCMRLWKSGPSEELTQQELTVSIDGMRRTVTAGEKLCLDPGQSICYEPYLYHTFWAEGGHCLVGEVSTVNDDRADNRFREASGRFPAIEEDQPARYVLCNEYPPAPLGKPVE